MLAASLISVCSPIHSGLPSSSSSDSPPCHSSELVLCRVTLQTELAYRKGARQKERSSPEPPLRFLQLSLSDLESKDKRSVPVNVTVSPPQGEEGGREGGGNGEAHSDAGGLPNLKELGPMELSVSADQFGSVAD